MTVFEKDYTQTLTQLIISPYLSVEEQTKLIAQGIQKGITLYKKQQKEKARQADKQKKKETKLKQKEQEAASQETIEAPAESQQKTMLPWILLIASWLGFALFYLVTQK